MSAEEWRIHLAEFADWYLGTVSAAHRSPASDRPRGFRLRREPATARQLDAAEERLGVPLPPSLRGFLTASNGFGPVSQYTEALRSCEEIDWFRSTHPGCVNTVGGTGDRDVLLHALCLTRGEDVILLDTRTASADGEYGAYLFAVKYGELDERYAGFGEVVLAGHAEIEWHRTHCV
ncbi:hypothetical protein BU52_22755 [Streptomyces toyocaensis]|uniref:Knr4/Smi1-like domain-containing protein n=1 Tax=Streptomyces toyocaensis TaxID=55952 RepID=A0A081XMU3_STRTO|nr:SMI1/KNR4 family protein [Streptomyces toyocaensis]KES04866.1 hypothetical protein BU52_22755 [Streptomyces toyocaensis]